MKHGNVTLVGNVFTNEYPISNPNQDLGALPKIYDLYTFTGTTGFVAAPDGWVLPTLAQLGNRIITLRNNSINGSQIKVRSAPYDGAVSPAIIIPGKINGYRSNFLMPDGDCVFLHCNGTYYNMIDWNQPPL